MCHHAPSACVAETPVEKHRSDIKQREEEARHARLEDRARLVEESRRSYEDRVRREEDEIAAREQEVCGGFPLPVAKKFDGRSSKMREGWGLKASDTLNIISTSIKTTSTRISSAEHVRLA